MHSSDGFGAFDLIYCLLLVGILSEAMQWDGGKRDERFYWPKTFLPTAAGGKSKIFGQSVQTFPSLPLKVAFDCGWSLEAMRI